MHILNIFSAIKKMTIKELKDFIYENYYRKLDFLKKSYYSVKHQKKKELLLATKLIEKIPDATNAKQYYQILLKRKNTKLIKQ